MSGRLVIMGSGETAPTMVEVHRATLRAAGEGPSLLLDTPYGFQENADDITQKAVAYFGRNVGRTVTPLVWRTRLDGAALDRALTAVRTARSVFAGPGSPTYALRVWAGTGFDDALAAVATAGGTVTFASAAALTIGVVTVPVYEIYKSGADPAWAPGTNLLQRLTGLRAALIPHYDNTEGGTHSTRFCYLGERRLRLLEGSLPAGSHVIGVDEHTALVFDLATGVATVLGNGAVTVRHDGASRVLPSGTVVPIAELAERSAGMGGSGPDEAADVGDAGGPGHASSDGRGAAARGTGEQGGGGANAARSATDGASGTSAAASAGGTSAAAGAGGTSAAAGAGGTSAAAGASGTSAAAGAGGTSAAAGAGGGSATGGTGATAGTGAAGGAGGPRGALRPPTSLRGAADRARAAFDVAMAARDADAAAGAVLELEQAITDWTADTLQSDDGDHARRTLRGMVLELAGAARDGLADPATRIAPLVDALLERRAAARSAQDFATADALRDRLAAAGVEVRDGPSGAEWSLRG